MSHLDRSLHRLLEQRLSQEGYELQDWVPIQLSGDRIARMRTLEEALDEIEQTPGEGVTYLIRVNPRQIAQPVEAKVEEEKEQKLYLPDGQINIPYLEQNAELLLASGEHALARNIYSTIYQSGQRTAQALYGMARCYEKENKIDLAVEKFEASIAYQPMLDAFYRLSALLIYQKKDRSAAEVLERALTLKGLGDDVQYEFHKAAGNCWTRAGRYEEAHKQYSLALHLKPNAEEVRANLGWLYLEQGQLSSAKRCFQDAIASNPNHERALFGLAKCFESEGLKAEAYGALVKTLERNNAHIQALLLLVKLAFELKHYGPAERLAMQYCDSQPVNPSLLYSLAAMQFHLGKMDEARSTVEKVLSIKPGHSGAQDLLQKMIKYF
jgi:tetratricopeptide (TPR) repeat protein